jgi:hypothetical protein
MKIGMFRRVVAKTLIPKRIKIAMRTTSKNTVRTLLARSTVALKVHTGQLLQTTGAYVLGAQQTQEMKDHALLDLGNIAYDLTVMARTLKVKLPSSTKKIKLVGTRGAALLQLDSLATNLLHTVEGGLFDTPPMVTVKKMVPMPQKGGVKEEREVRVVDAEADEAAEATRQNQMRSFLSGAIDIYWRLCFDLLGEPPAGVLEAMATRLKADYPEEAPAPTPVAPAAPKGKVTFPAAVPPAKKAPVKGKKAQPEAVTA